MRVMCSNDSSTWYMAMCRKHPDKLGWLIGPRHWKNPRGGVAFALDNDAYSCFTKGTPYDFDAWFRFLDKVGATGMEPLWALVPDVVGNREKTLEQWHKYSPVIRERGWNTALALQDGMTDDDVEDCCPDLIFVGGTTEWKWNTAHNWCQWEGGRVHVGRVRARRLRYCQQIGAESCDGTGWFRESVRGKPARQLEAWLENPEPHPELSLL